MSYRYLSTENLDSSIIMIEKSEGRHAEISLRFFGVSFKWVPCVKGIYSLSYFSKVIDYFISTPIFRTNNMM